MEGLDREEQMEGAANILTIIQPTTVLESSLAWFKTLYIVLYLDSSYLTSSDDWITVNEPSDASKENTLSQISQISTPMESLGPQNILENPKSAEKSSSLDPDVEGSRVNMITLENSLSNQYFPKVTAF